MKSFKINLGEEEIEIFQDEDGTFIKPQFIKDFEKEGTAFKPAVEPIVVARKPLSEKNVALNVLKWGTGGINIDGCRIIPNGDDLIRTQKGNHSNSSYSITNSTFNFGTKCNHRDKDGNCLGHPKANGSLGGGIMRHGKNTNPQGRFPANIILDEEAGKLLDEQTGELSNSSRQNRLNNKVVTPPWKGFSEDEKTEWKPTGLEHDDKGGASRFFYCAKASKSERNLGIDKNNHPTVKPIKLMEYLVKLVSKEGATVLDPFLGSGTTAIACLKQGRKFIGIEKEEEYIEIAEARINKVKEQTTLIQPIMLNNNKKEKNNGKK